MTVGGSTPPIRSSASPAAAPILRLRGVRKSFAGTSGILPAAGPIDLDVWEGEFICLIGPSGCGKTTFLNLVAGLERPDEGDLLFDGRPVEGPGPDRIVIFQDLGLFPWRTVEGNVEFGLRLRDVPRADRERIVTQHLRMVHLSAFRRSFVHELSGGMKQRVALARALAMEPRMLLMDEPFAALDAQTRDMLHDELQEIWTRTRRTIFFVTHNVLEAATLADRVITFTRRPGRIKETIRVGLPHPRHIEDPAVVAIAARVRRGLAEEIAAGIEEEHGVRER